MNDDVAVSAKVEAPPTAAVSPEAAATRARELERNRRADAARITALVQYMLLRGQHARDLH